MTAHGLTLAEKLKAIGRRSLNDLHALETLADHVLERLDKGQGADPAAYEWKCEQAKPTKAND